MSNGRRSPIGNRYRTGYLKSAARFRRRDAWFAEQATRTTRFWCVVCWRPATRRQLELHHLDYTKVTRRGSRWIAGEAHEDLCPMHPGCHERVHRTLDADPVLRRHRTRRVATMIAIRTVRSRLGVRTRP